MKKHTPNPTRVMPDIETLGTRPGSVMLSIGAVKFDARRIIDEFYIRIDPASCMALGMTIDAPTVIWWLKQSDAARTEAGKPGVALRPALEYFAQWLADRNVEVWGNGPAFDNAHLAEAYLRCGLPLPWRYANDRCYRTLCAQFPRVRVVREGIAHHALDDARTQAKHVIKLLRRTPRV
jgi:exodeoxyribonuclease VIII